MPDYISALISGAIEGLAEFDGRSDFYRTLRRRDYGIFGWWRIAVGLAGLLTWRRQVTKNAEAAIAQSPGFLPVAIVPERRDEETADKERPESLRL